MAKFMLLAKEIQAFLLLPFCSSSRLINRRLRKVLRVPRNGANPLEYNNKKTQFLGDLDEKYNHHVPSTLASTASNNKQRLSTLSAVDERIGYYHQQHPRRMPKPLSQVLSEKAHILKQNYPTIYYTFVTSIMIHFLWQIPPLSPFLQRHFLCSKSNITRLRLYVSFLSSLSHTSTSHLLLNLYGFYTFGSSVFKTLKRYEYQSAIFSSLWVFCLLAATFSSAIFMLIHPNGSCLGLSGITLALLAFDTKVYPSKELAFMIKFIPIRLPAQYVLTVILAISLLGVVGSTLNGGIRSDGIAHATHLGGIIFGLCYYEALTRGLITKLRNWSYNQTRRRRKKVC